MTKNNEKISEQLRKDRHKFFRKVSIYIGIFAFLIISTIAYSTGKSREVNGIVTSFRSEASQDTGEKFYIYVETESNENISFLIPRETLVKIGDRVKVVETQTNFFNFK